MRFRFGAKESSFAKATHARPYACDSLRGRGAPLGHSVHSNRVRREGPSATWARHRSVPMLMHIIHAHLGRCAICCACCCRRHAAMRFSEDARFVARVVVDATRLSRSYGPQRSLEFQFTWLNLCRGRPSPPLRAPPACPRALARAERRWGKSVSLQSRGGHMVRRDKGYQRGAPRPARARVHRRLAGLLVALQIPLARAGALARA